MPYNKIFIARNVQRNIGPRLFVLTNLALRARSVQKNPRSATTAFLILQHFATKLCNFTNFNMLFLAVVMDFVLNSCLDQNLVYSWNHPLHRVEFQIIALLL